MSCPWSAGQLFFLCYYRINMPPLCEIGQGWLKAFDNARLTADNFKKASLSPVRNDYGQWMERDSISRIILRNQGEYALGIAPEDSSPKPLAFMCIQQQFRHRIRVLNFSQLIQCPLHLRFDAHCDVNYNI